MNQKSMIITAGIVLVVLFMVMQIDQLRELIGLPQKAITA